MNRPSSGQVLVEEAAALKTSFSEETHWEKAAKTRMGRYLTKMESNFIKKSLNSSGLNTLMDVGAEAGRFSQSPLENAQILSIDIDLYGLKRLQLKTKNATLIQADARKIPLKTETLDAVLMIEVLDYIPELLEVFAECYRTLKPGASIIVSFGNKSSLKAKFRETQGKSYQHSYERVTKSLSGIGFELKKIMGYNWLPFGRTSENPLIPILTLAESLFTLKRIPRYSPWVIVHAIKPD